MSKSSLVVLGNIAIVAVLSMVVVYLRAAHMSSAEDIAKKGMSAITRENMVFFGIVLPVVVGLISLYVYRHWYVGHTQNFLWLAIGIGVALSILAAVFFKRALVEFSVLHVFHIVFFGYVMPLLLK